MQTDESLNRLLKEWRLDPVADPNFRAGVWRRIAVDTAETWSTYLQRHVVGWSLLATVALSAGGWIGHARAAARNAAARDQLVIAYVQSIDPRAQAAEQLDRP
jgi:hypothetical protein